jgi:hypothetical protein
MAYKIGLAENHFDYSIQARNSIREDLEKEENKLRPKP